MLQALHRNTLQLPRSTWSTATTLNLLLPLLQIIATLLRVALLLKLLLFVLPVRLRLHVRRVILRLLLRLQLVLRLQECNKIVSYEVKGLLGTALEQRVLDALQRRARGRFWGTRDIGTTGRMIRVDTTVHVQCLACASEALSLARANPRPTEGASV